MSAVRITANGRSIGTAEATNRVHEAGESARKAKARFQSSGDHPGGGAGSRVLVTRTDVGSRNVRLIANEARKRGAVNPRSDASFTANPEPMAVITAGSIIGGTASRGRDSFGDEGGAPANPDIRAHFHRVNGTKVECECGIR